MSEKTKIKVKDSSNRAVEGTLNLNEDLGNGANLEIIGMDEPILLTDLFREYDGKSVSIKIGYTEQLTSDDLDSVIE